MTDGRARERSHPVGDAVGVDDAELEPAVVRASVVEHLDTAEEASDVAEEDAARSAGVPGRAVDLDLRLERLGAEVLRAGPDVGHASEPILERAVGLLDHRRVEAGSGHDGEALAVEPADIELAPFAAEADRDRLLDVLRDAEVRREQVRGAGRAGSRAASSEPAIASIARWTVPSPPQTKSSSAPSASARFTCFGANRLFGTSTQIGSATPWRASSRRSSVSPPPKDLPACATTATLRHLAALPEARVTRTSAHKRGDPDDHAARDVDRVVHAAIHPGEGDEDRDQRRDDPDRDLCRAVLDPRGRGAARARSRRRSTPRCGPTGSSRSTGSLSRRWTSGRCRWTRSVVAR